MSDRLYFPYLTNVTICLLKDFCVINAVFLQDNNTTEKRKKTVF